MIGQFQNFAVETLVELLGERRFRACADEVRAADATREEGVSGQDEPGLRSPGLVGDQDRDAVGRMPRRVEDRETHVPQIVVLTIRDLDMREPDWRGLMEEHGGARHIRETTGPGKVIGLDMRLEDVRDPHGFLCGRLEVGLDLELWIHHSAGACAPSAEQVAGAAGLRGQKVAKDHGVLLSVSGVVIRPSVL